MFETYQQQARTTRDRKDKEDIASLRNEVGWIEHTQSTTTLIRVLLQVYMNGCAV